MSPAKSKKPRTSRRLEAGPSFEPGESQASVAATVAWMLGTMTTLVAEVAALVLELFARRYPNIPAILMLGRLLLFAAAVGGVVTLVMLLVARRVRRVSAPSSVIVASAAIAIIPIVAIALLLLSGR